jgi:hypothetical protein
MKAEICGFEDAVSAALGSGEWSAELRAHLNGCAPCAELELVYQSLAHATKNENTAPLPAPGLIWWRSQLEERREQAERALAAIALMQKLAIAVALVAAVAFMWFAKPGVWPVLLGLSMLLATGAVLYGWERGRI